MSIEVRRGSGNTNHDPGIWWTGLWAREKREYRGDAKSIGLDLRPQEALNFGRWRKKGEVVYELFSEAKIELMDEPKMLLFHTLNGEEDILNCAGEVMFDPAKGANRIIFTRFGGATHEQYEVHLVRAIDIVNNKLHVAKKKLLPIYLPR